MMQQKYKYFAIQQHDCLKIFDKRKRHVAEKIDMPLIIDINYLCSPSIFSIHTISYHLPNFFPHL